MNNNDKNTNPETETIETTETESPFTNCKQQILNANNIIGLCIIFMLILSYVGCKLRWLLCVQIIFCGSAPTVCAQLMFDNWITTTTDPSLPVSLTAAAVAYDNSIDTIHFVGGQANPQLLRKRLSYNEGTNPNTISYYNSLAFPEDYYGYGQTYVQRGDILWMIHPLNPVLHKWNMKTNTYFVDDIVGLTPQSGWVFRSACLASYKDYLIVIHGTPDTVQIYSFATMTWLMDVPSLYSRKRSDLACITVNDEIYAIGGNTYLFGNSIGTVEYLDLSDISHIKNYNW
eukprot:347437_1